MLLRILSGCFGSKALAAALTGFAESAVSCGTVPVVAVAEGSSVAALTVSVISVSVRSVAALTVNFISVSLTTFGGQKLCV